MDESIKKQSKHSADNDTRMINIIISFLTTVAHFKGPSIFFMEMENNTLNSLFLWIPSKGLADKKNGGHMSIKYSHFLRNCHEYIAVFEKDRNIRGL